MDRFNKVCEVVVRNDNPITCKNHFLLICIPHIQQGHAPAVLVIVPTPLRRNTASLNLRKT